jgi:hypothetical protein
MAEGHRRVGVSLRQLFGNSTPFPTCPLSGGRSLSTGSTKQDYMRSSPPHTAIPLPLSVLPLPRSLKAEQRQFAASS